MITDELTVLARGLGRFDAPDDVGWMLASLVMSSREFIGIADLDGNALYVNEAGRLLVGLPDLETARATRIIDYFAEADRAKVLEVVLPAVRRSGFWQGDLNFRHFETGRLIPVLYNIFPVRDSAGELVAYGTVTRDLSESKLADQRLRFLASVVESSDDAIVTKSLDGVITSWNNGAERVFGYTRQEAVGRPITILIPDDRHSEETEILSRIRRGERIEHFETIRQRKSGDPIAVSLTVSPVKDAGGRIIGASKIARDITEQRKNLQQIATLAREAEHRSKNLLLNVQAMVRLSKSDTVQGLKEAIEGRIHALANVHSLFVETRWVGAELSAIAEQELAPYAGRRQRRINVEGPRTLLEPNAAQAIAVVLHELATNAAKYGSLSRAEGNIELKWRSRTDGQLELHWIETGGPEVKKPTRHGFGGRVVEEMTGQLKGDVQFDWRREGLVCQISFPAGRDV